MILVAAVGQAIILDNVLGFWGKVRGQEQQEKMRSSRDTRLSILGKLAVSRRIACHDDERLPNELPPKGKKEENDIRIRLDVFCHDVCMIQQLKLPVRQRINGSDQISRPFGPLGLIAWCFQGFSGTGKAPGAGLWDRYRQPRRAVRDSSPSGVWFYLWSA